MERLEWPAAGRKASLPPCAGSGDAWLIAQLARHPGRKGTLAVVTALAVDASRLQDEIGFFDPTIKCAVLPDWETLPYDAFSPHQDLISERLATLYELQRGAVDVLLIPASTAVHRLVPREFLASRTFFFEKGQQLDEAGLREQLVIAGYENVSQVVRPGEFSIRGGLIDLFPMGSRLPYRLDLFGPDIETIRTFDPDTQRSLYPIDRVRLLPGREFPLDEAARGLFRGRWRERFEGDPSRCPIYRDVGSGIAPAGIEYYLPLFHERTASLFEHLPADATLLLHGDVESALRGFAEDTRQRHAFLRHDPERPVLDPAELFLGIDEFFAAANAQGRFAMNRQAAGGGPSYTAPPPDVAIDRRASEPTAPLRRALADGDRRYLLVAESAGRRETLQTMLGEHGIASAAIDDWAAFIGGQEPVGFAVAPLADGFSRDEAGIVVLTEAELFVGAVRRRRGGRREAVTDVDAIIRDLSELKAGDPVVHVQHGIGRYEGLVSMDLGDGATEFLHLRYAGDATLYVPVSQLHLIMRYSGASPEEAPLHQLGSGQWEKARRRAAAQAHDTAAELLNIYARRATRTGHRFAFDSLDYETFAEGFGFEETPDQLAAIHAVVQDMVSGRPMDRLVCGDVGFGKTEVALRAAFVAIADGQQVALLAPTTLLAEQHFQTFSDRFANWPVRLALLSRFRSPKEVSAAIDEINGGRIDIVIGTHKLLSSHLKFPRLGLVIIDEEHRFGVRQKEALKALRAEVDVLTLTATPIPRTLAMSLEGIRDFSVIATAPQKRLAIKTFVRRESDGAIREALLRELKRGGQVYFLHNEVSTIENRRERLARLVPEARIAVAHGQMAERDLERVMRDFHQQRFNVLLCTTIIETGIDIPTANTIVIHRADKFGLAQLHQLRGRVGRSHHQAYAYLLIPDESAITRDAGKRLEAIQLMEDLGSGFYLSMHDLEIRGAGEVLGESQAGDMQQVGFAMYTEMLDEAVRALKEGREPDMEAPFASTTEINLHLPALLPTDYCPDVHERLTLYKRLANCGSTDALDGLQEELIDRFGKLPDQARALVDTHRLRILSRPLGVARIDASETVILIQFVAEPPIDPLRIIQFIQSRKDTRLAGPDRLRIETSTGDAKERAQRIREILGWLARPADAPASKPGKKSRNRNKDEARR
ncbi:MAG: transcription-repair coupling factor [Burkholderiaceae bacterium]|nr:transcription-repair coupling factor [Burkholderiaceae bacterium]MEB2319821.1 transcription-repair coupling factor [Pseudomonadota bacterium]